MKLAQRIAEHLDVQVADPVWQRPLRIGDAEQAERLDVMNGDYAYCPACWSWTDLESDVGLDCHSCGDAKLIPGAAMVRRVGTRRLESIWKDNRFSDQAAGFGKAARWTSSSPETR